MRVSCVASEAPFPVEASFRSEGSALLIQKIPAGTHACTAITHAEGECDV